MASKNFTISYPHLLDEWDYAANTIAPELTTMGDKNKYWWVCKTGHKWKSTILHRAYHKSGCSECDRNSRIIAGRKQYIQAVCDNGHAYSAKVNDLNINGYQCQYCKNNKVLTGYNDMFTLSPYLSEELHEILNDFTAKEILNTSTRKAFWQCKFNQAHIWEAKIRNRTVRGDGCTYCSNKKVLLGYNDIETTSPQLLEEWDYEANTGLDPKNFHSGSQQKVNWVCSEGHKWSSRISHRSEGRGCRSCASYGYSDAKPSTLYFLHNSTYGSYKIGITNSDSNRIARFNNLGWKTVTTVNHVEGKAIRDIETEVFKWIRKELTIPYSLNKHHMGTMGGWTETFSSDAVDKNEILNKIAFLCRKFILK